MEKVRIHISDLMEEVKNNLEKHKEDYNKMIKKYRTEVIGILNNSLITFNKGDESELNIPNFPRKPSNGTIKRFR